MEGDDVGLLCIEAAKKGDVEKVKAMVEERGTQLLEAKGTRGYTLLQNAISSESMQLISYLVKLGADANEPDWDGDTSVFWACEISSLPALKCLVEEGGANLHVENKDGDTPLHIACKRGCLPIVRYLLANGCDVSAQDMDGYTPLHFSWYFGRVSVACHLILNGANVTLKDSGGCDCMTYLQRRDSLGMSHLQGLAYLIRRQTKIVAISYTNQNNNHYSCEENDDEEEE